MNLLVAQESRRKLCKIGISSLNLHLKEGERRKGKEGRGLPLGNLASQLLKHGNAFMLQKLIQERYS